MATMETHEPELLRGHCCRVRMSWKSRDDSLTQAIGGPSLLRSIGAQSQRDRWVIAPQCPCNFLLDPSPPARLGCTAKVFRQCSHYFGQRPGLPEQAHPPRCSSGSMIGTSWPKAATAFASVSGRPHALGVVAKAMAVMMGWCLGNEVGSPQVRVAVAPF